MPTASDMREAIALLELQNRDAVRLGELVSLAARVEPELLRAARVELTPFDASAEADLWFSQLVETRTADWISLVPAAAHELRAALAADASRLGAAHALITEAHSGAPATIRLEEEILWLALTAPHSARQAIEERLRFVLVKLLEDPSSHRGLAHWFAGAARRLPEEAQATETYAYLSVVTSGLLDGRRLDAPEPKRRLRLDALAGVLPDSIPRLRVWATLTDYGLTLRPNESHGSVLLEVPRTDPLLFEAHSLGEPTQLIMLRRGETRNVRLTSGVVELRTAAGDVYRLRPRPRELSSTVPEGFAEGSGGTGAPVPSWSLPEPVSQMRTITGLYKLRPGQILEVVRDLHLASRGYKIILVPDAHELYDYCFPINPNDERGKVDLEELAESQLGLNYLFKTEERDHPPVVMLDEYREELKASMDRIFREADPAHYDAELLMKLVKSVDFGNMTQQELTELKAKLESIVQKNFQILLTILLGIHSLGVSRMNEVYARGLTSVLDAVEPEDRNYFKTLLKGYKRSRLYHAINERLEQHKAGPSLALTEAKRRANHIDASAIDLLIYLNEAASRGWYDGLLNHNYLFLYISSALKTAAVFAMKEVKSSLPKVRGRRYPIWRNLHQVFAYVVHRSRGANTRENVLRTAKSLRALDGLLKRVQEFEQVYKSRSQDCHDCVLTGETPRSCPLVEFCLDLKATAEKIKQKKEEETNWGLFRQIESYAYLRESTASKLQLDFKIYMQLFTDIIESNPLKDIALERMYQRHLWIYRASEWTTLVSRMTEGLDPAKAHDLRAEKDHVTGIDQHLPCKPELKSGAYRDIIALILKFFREPKRLDLFEQAYRKFLDLVPSSGQDDEYDLLRAYLYLTFSFKEETHSNVLEILLPKVEVAGTDYAVRESLYVLCWSARCAGLFEEADRYALQGIERFPDDARFRHGRALNTYCWVTKDSEGCPNRIRDAIRDSEKALELYRRGGDENVDLVGACHNNIAFFLVLDLVMDAVSGHGYDMAERTRRFNLAREHMAQLERLIDKQTGWNPAHPEFFHTEAFLKYHLALHYLAGASVTKAELLETLRGANASIRTALDIYAPTRYQKLKREIDKLSARIR